MAENGGGIAVQIRSISVDSIHFDWSTMSGTTMAALTFGAGLLGTTILLLCVSSRQQQKAAATRLQKHP